MSLQNRKQAQIKGALMMFLNGKMAQDAKVDLDSLLDGIDNENYPQEKRALLERIREALRGKLREGASIGELHQLLTALEAVPEGEDSPPEFEGMPRTHDENDPRTRERLMGRLTAEDRARVERVNRFAGAQDAFLERYPEMRRVKVL